MYRPNKYDIKEKGYIMCFVQLFEIRLVLKFVVHMAIQLVEETRLKGLLLSRCSIWASMLFVPIIQRSPIFWAIKKWSYYWIYALFFNLDSLLLIRKQTHPECFSCCVWCFMKNFQKYSRQYISNLPKWLKTLIIM